MLQPTIIASSHCFLLREPLVLAERTVESDLREVLEAVRATAPLDSG